MTRFDAIPRLRMFAGPNGSGKSTLKKKFELNYKKLLGIYVNPDEIESEFKRNGYISLRRYQITPDVFEIREFFSRSSLLKKARSTNWHLDLSLRRDELRFGRSDINSYIASVVASFIRQKLVELRRSFSFETVMSSSDKTDFLSFAKLNEYRNYLYFVATKDPLVNISRVEYRAKSGGHSVPHDKIISRYKRSLDLLPFAIRLSNRAFIYDNSGEELILIAEITDANNIRIMSRIYPQWFKTYVLDKLS